MDPSGHFVTNPASTSELAIWKHFNLQWGGKVLDQCILNSVIRFLLHGAIVRASDGQGIHLTSHILRHAFATEMAGMKVPVDVIAAILHQRDTSVTNYYSQLTRTQVMEAAELVFVDRMDVATEALRSPAEIGLDKYERAWLAHSTNGV